ncbi:AhpC/TSA family protein [bacterium AH-315-J21]|nr:AhpC/TSA family protein [bacterium AH-315-J21]
MSLSEDIKAMQEELIPNIPQEAMEIIMRTSGAVIESGVDKNGLKAGSAMPEFSLSDATGKEVSSKELLSRGPLVISFYRGAWCPYCNVELHALQNALPDMQELGATLVAISPNKPDASITSVEKHNLKFTVLSDIGNVVAEKFGLVVSVPEEVRPVYKQFDFDVTGQNGDNSFKVPIPATYVVDTSGEIIHAFVNADYTQREEPSIVIDVLKRIGETTKASV